MMINPDYAPLFEALVEFNALLNGSLKIKPALEKKVQSAARGVVGRANWHLGAMVGLRSSGMHAKTRKLLAEISEFSAMLERVRARRKGRPRLEETATLKDFLIAREFDSGPRSKARINDAARRGLLDLKKTHRSQEKRIKRRVERLGK
jgi:hypothetical protein